MLNVLQFTMHFCILTYSRKNGFFSPLPPLTIDFSIKFFDYHIIHECDLLFGLLSSSVIQTQAFVFSQLFRWQGGSGPWGGLPAPKTTTAKTLTNTATTMTTQQQWWPSRGGRNERRRDQQGQLLPSTVRQDNNSVCDGGDGIMVNGGRSDFCGRPQRGPG